MSKTIVTETVSKRQMVRNGKDISTSKTMVARKKVTVQKTDRTPSAKKKGVAARERPALPKMQTMAEPEKRPRTEVDKNIFDPNNPEEETKVEANSSEDLNEQPTIFRESGFTKDDIFHAKLLKAAF